MPLHSSPPFLAISVTLIPGFSFLIPSRAEFSHSMYADRGRFGFSAIVCVCWFVCYEKEICKNNNKKKKRKNLAPGECPP